VVESGKSPAQDCNLRFGIGKPVSADLQKERINQLRWQIISLTLYP